MKLLWIIRKNEIVLVLLLTSLFLWSMLALPFWPFKTRKK